MRTLAGRKDTADRSGREKQADDTRIDSASVRWVFAATLAFWLAVYVAGRALF